MTLTLEFVLSILLPMTKKTILMLVVVLLVPIFFFLQNKSGTIDVERTLNAPIDKVWNTWTDPEAMKKWWGPKDYTAPVIRSDFRAKGLFLFAMKSPGDKVSWNAGEYTEIVPKQKITMKMSFADQNGRTVSADHYGVPGKWPEVVDVKIDFKEVDGKTTVHVREEGIPMIMFVFAKMGWDQQFDKLDKLLQQ